jgi:hypothetical protein
LSFVLSGMCRFEMSQFRCRSLFPPTFRPLKRDSSLDQRSLKPREDNSPDLYSSVCCVCCCWLVPACTYSKMVDSLSILKDLQRFPTYVSLAAG